MPDLIKLAGFALMLGTATITVNTRLNNIDKKIDVLQATQMGVQNVNEQKFTTYKDQLDLNTLTIKTIAEFLKPEPPTIKRRRE
jgi:limonene-1,2-epoxide hydrolase